MTGPGAPAVGLDLGDQVRVLRVPLHDPGSVDRPARNFAVGARSVKGCAGCRGEREFFDVAHDGPCVFQRGVIDDARDPPSHCEVEPGIGADDTVDFGQGADFVAKVFSRHGGPPDEKGHRVALIDTETGFADAVDGEVVDTLFRDAGVEKRPVQVPRVMGDEGRDAQAGGLVHVAVEDEIAAFHGCASAAITRLMSPLMKRSILRSIASTSSLFFTMIAERSGVVP